jgi:hypothetical protein
MFDDLRERAMAEYEDEEPESLGTVQDLLGGLTPQQKFILSLMLFLNVLFIGCMLLIAFGRI